MYTAGKIDSKSDRLGIIHLVKQYFHFIVKLSAKAEAEQSVNNNICALNCLYCLDLIGIVPQCGYAVIEHQFIHISSFLTCGVSHCKNNCNAVATFTKLASNNKTVTAIIALTANNGYTFCNHSILFNFIPDIACAGHSGIFHHNLI